MQLGRTQNRYLEPVYYPCEHIIANGGIKEGAFWGEDLMSAVV